MRKWLTISLPLLLFAAQQPPAAPPQNPTDTAPGGVFRLPPANPEPAEAAKEEPPKKTILTFEGKPMRIPYACSEDDMQTFGMTCTDRSACPIYAELAGLQPLGQRIFLSGNLHNGSSTMYSLLLSTSDGGKTWEEPVERFKSALLDHIQFFDLETGWISGQLLQAFPRDPFFMITTDGGRNWRQRPVFGESRISSVEQYWFDSKTAGTLLIDRGTVGEGRWERYETMTGGESWMLREISSSLAKLRPAKVPPPNADWRLRPDTNLKANVLERRQGDRWQTVASFLLQPGECRPELDPLAPPPPPPEPVVAPAKPPRPVAPSKPPTLKKK